MIVTSISTSEDCVWTGGWDGVVRRWRIAADKLEAAGYINVGASINALVAPAPNIAYAVVSGGRVVRIGVE